MNKSVLPVDDLKNKMYVTYSARFNADCRLKHEHKLASYAMLCLALYIAILAIGNIYEAPFLNIPHADFWSLVLSIALIGTSALEAGYNREKRAYKFHDNALKISALYRKLSALNQPDEKKLIDIQEQYDGLLAQNEENHLPIDVHRRQIGNRDLDCSVRLSHTFAFCWQYILRGATLYWLMIAVPPIYYLYYTF